MTLNVTCLNVDKDVHTYSLKIPVAYFGRGIGAMSFAEVSGLSLLIFLIILMFLLSGCVQFDI